MSGPTPSGVERQVPDQLPAVRAPRFSSDCMALAGPDRVETQKVLARYIFPFVGHFRLQQELQGGGIFCPWDCWSSGVVRCQGLHGRFNHDIKSLSPSSPPSEPRGQES